MNSNDCRVSGPAALNRKFVFESHIFGFQDQINRPEPGLHVKQHISLQALKVGISFFVQSWEEKKGSVVTFAGGLVAKNGNLGISGAFREPGFVLYGLKRGCSEEAVNLPQGRVSRGFGIIGDFSYDFGAVCLVYVLRDLFG